MLISTKLSVFIATSLDACIACNDGAIDWLERANATVPAGEDCGYADFMQTADAIVMGRATFVGVSCSEAGSVVAVVVGVVLIGA